MRRGLRKTAINDNKKVPQIKTQKCTYRCVYQSNVGSSAGRAVSNCASRDEAVGLEGTCGGTVGLEWICGGTVGSEWTGNELQEAGCVLKTTR